MSNKTSDFVVRRSKKRKITHMPEWLIKLKGKFDSRKGKETCDEYLRKLIKKEAAFESIEVIDAENALLSTRKAGANALVTLSEKKTYLSDFPNERKENSVDAIRANRRNAEMKNLAQSAIKEIIELISQLNETIIYADTILDERIIMLRNQTSEKSHIYISGVRAGKITDYEFPMNEYDDKPRQIYREKHNELDMKIRSITNECMKEDRHEFVS